MTAAEEIRLLTSSMLAMQEAFIRLGEIVRTHLSEYENQQDYISFGPEPSDEVRELIEGVKAL